MLHGLPLTIAGPSQATTRHSVPPTRPESRAGGIPRLYAQGNIWRPPQNKQYKVLPGALGSLGPGIHRRHAALVTALTLLVSLVTGPGLCLSASPSERPSSSRRCPPRRVPIQPVPAELCRQSHSLQWGYRTDAALDTLATVKVTSQGYRRYRLSLPSM